jgi:PAS domain S-box-containing protein
MSSDSKSITEHEHLRLLNALRESELLRELAELLASSLDLTQILHVLVRRTTEACDVERCAVWLLDEESNSFHPSAYHISSPHLQSKDIQKADQIWHRKPLPLADPTIQQLLTEQGMMLYQEDLQATGSQIMQAIAKTFLVKSVLLIALIRERRTVGMMSLDIPGKQWVFSTEQQQLARAIGQQAAVAIDNARIYQQAETERRHAERLTARVQALHQVALAVNAGEDVMTVLGLATRHLVSGLEASGIAMTLFAGERLQVARTLGLVENTIAPTYPPTLEQLARCEAAAQQGQPIFVYKEQISGIEERWFQQLGLENVLIVPLIVSTHSNGTPDIPRQSPFATRTSAGFAFINYQRNNPAPGAEQYTFAQDIATQCAMAVERDHILSTTRHIASLAMERANTLDAVFNAMNEGITVLDMQGRVLLRNNSAGQILATQGNTPSGQSPPDQLPDLFTQQAIYTLKRRKLALEEMPLVRGLRGESIRGERVLTKHTDGTERILEMNIVPLFDGRVQQIGIVSAFRDVTEQVQAEQRTRRALDTMLHAAEIVSGLTQIDDILQRTLSMTMSVLSCQRGVVQYYDKNQQAFIPLISIGVSVDKEQGWLAKQRAWLSPDDTIYAQLSQGHAVLIQPGETTGKAGKGEKEQLFLIAAPITHRESLLGVMLLERTAQGSSQPAGEKRDFSLWDVAVIEGIAQFTGLAIEQVRWQQEAEQARMHEAAMRASNDLKDEFLALTAHEFRTPLTVILAHSQMMERAFKKAPMQEWPERLHDSIDNIESQAHQLTNIVNTFLEVTQLNRGQIILQKEKLNLEEVVQQAVKQHEATTEHHQLSYRAARNKRTYLIEGDRARLLQIFANLLQNAIKYSPHGGPISVSMSQHSSKAGGREVEIRIQDKGIGVPQDAQARLFESFYRAPNIHSAGPSARGVGLGLYVVAEFLRLHGGTIRVESKGIEGEGSCFIITLPIVDEREDKKDERTT